MLSLEKLRKIYGDYKIVPSNPMEVRFCCPYCVKIGKPPDTKYHLYINLEKHVGFCFRCNKVLKFDGWQNVKVIDFYKESKKKKIDFIKTEKLDENGFKFLRYKLGKFYNDKELEKLIEEYKIETCIYPSELKGRIVFPITYYGKVLGWQLRSIKGEEPKYFIVNFVDNLKDFFFNYDKIKGDVVYLVEGIFDVLPIKDCAICGFGKMLSKNQKMLLSMLALEKKIVICFDGDAYQDAENLAIELTKKYGIEKVYVKKLPEGKDPGDLGKEIFKIREVEYGNRLL